MSYESLGEFLIQPMKWVFLNQANTHGRPSEQGIRWANRVVRKQFGTLVGIISAYIALFPTINIPSSPVHVPTDNPT
jgi:hypothetical protein